MALRHATSGEIVDIPPLGEAIDDVPSTAIVRDDHVEVMRLVLPAGKTVPQHQVEGPITVQCLEGEVEVAAHNETKRLRPQQLMYLSGGVSHAFHALTDASVLVTVVRFGSP
ncbi:MAG TPA: cupin domain-containing protein [Zeimonas sp.]|nr:cupin domain-containing protein [Zeimonas sp.]